MKTLRIFDRVIHLKNRTEFEDITEEKLEALDGMLNDYGVAHCFALATAEEIDKVSSKREDFEYCCDLQYCEEDEVTLQLVYMLWAKTQRGATDKQIREACTKCGVQNIPTGFSGWLSVVHGLDLEGFDKLSLEEKQNILDGYDNYIERG